MKVRCRDLGPLTRISLPSLWRHRRILLNMLNQIAFGTEQDAEYASMRYSGTPEFGRRVHRASKEVIFEVKGQV